MQGSKEEWSQQETLLLLEGIQVYGEAWPKVAAHVGTKPSFKCALRFLQVDPQASLVAHYVQCPDVVGIQCSNIVGIPFVSEPLSNLRCSYHPDLEVP